MLLIEEIKLISRLTVNNCQGTYNSLITAVCSMGSFFSLYTTKNQNKKPLLTIKYKKKNMRHNNNIYLSHSIQLTTGYKICCCILI